MNIDDVLSEIGAQVKRNAEAKMMSLGQFIDALEALPQDRDVRMDFSYYGPGDFRSYRGYYDHVALIGTSPESQTVAELLAKSKSALGRSFGGWKGGDYVMTESTPLWWASDAGECHDTGIVGVTFESYCVVIHTAFVTL